MKTRLILLMLLALISPAHASRSLNGTTDYMDGGTATLTAQASPMAVGGCVNLTAITGSDQVLASRIVAAGNNGWEFRVKATTGVLTFSNPENQSVDGTATTAVTAGSWQCVAAVVTGSGGTGNVHFVRYTLSTGAKATEEVAIFFSPAPSGTFKLLVGGRWVGSLQFPTGGLLARFFENSGSTPSDTAITTFFCGGAAPAGSNGVWALDGTASPEPDTSGNGYNLTLTGTVQGANPTACPSIDNPFFRRRLQH